MRHMVGLVVYDTYTELSIRVKSEASIKNKRGRRLGEKLGHFCLSHHDSVLLVRCSFTLC